MRLKQKPFGFIPFYTGPKLGGYCIPIDPFYLNWKGKQQNLKARFIEPAGKVNLKMPDYVIGRCEEELTRRDKELGGSKILVT